jgi:hypothetical protein
MRRTCPTELEIRAPAAGSRFIGTYGEARIVLAFQVRQKAVQSLLPTGWLPCPLTTGPGKGANLTVSFIDQLFVQTSDGKTQDISPVGALGIPAKQTDTGETAVMVFGGFSPNPRYAPGVYGNFVLARPAVERSIGIDEAGTSHAQECWEFCSDGGEGISLDLRYARGEATSIPDLCRLYRIEQAVDVVHSTIAGIDRVGKFKFKASGKRLSSLFNDVERPISIISNPWYTRQVLLVSAGTQ